MSKFAATGCNHCANTGILRATLVKTDEGNHIGAVVCGEHFNNDLAEKNLTAMHLASGLDIDIISVEKISEKK